MTKEIIEYLNLDWERYKEVFAKSLDSQIPLLDYINNYILDNSGKQLRPMLCLLAAKACAGKCSDLSVYCAAASELLHTATLLHDDVVDESLLRRGKPTVNAFVSSTAAVLVGDFWLSKAIYHIIESENMSIIKIFRNCFEELSKGELFQMEKAKSLDTTIDDYYKIISYKTSSLFKATMLGGAHSVNANEEQLKAIGDYASHLGNAFQMRDDILDYSKSLNIGKPVGQDILDSKITLPLICLMENMDEIESQSIKKKLKRGRKRYILNAVHKGGGVEQAQKILEKEANKAIESLNVIEDSQAKELLVKLAKRLCLRTS